MFCAGNLFGNKVKMPGPSASVQRNPTVAKGELLEAYSAAKDQPRTTLLLPKNLDLSASDRVLSNSVSKRPVIARRFA
jgi:hypothetical protein